MHAGAQFIAEFFGASSTHPVYLSALPNERDGKPGERHLISRDAAAIESFVNHWDRPGRAVYFAVNTIRLGETKRAKSTVAEITALHADIDFDKVDETPDEIKHKISQLHMAPTSVIYSGHGYHLYWALKEALPATPENIQQVEQLLRKLADHLGSDPAVCEIARLMRLPGSHNSKDSSSIEVRVVMNGNGRYDLEELAEWLEEATTTVLRRKADTSAKANSNGQSEDNPFFRYGTEEGPAPIDVEERLAAMTLHGDGDTGIHVTQLACTSALLNRGTPVDDAVEIVLEATRRAATEAGESWNWNQEEKDVRDMCVSWLQKHPELLKAKADEPRRPALAVWWHGDIDIQASRKFLVKNLIPETGNGLMPGQWGTYKTFAALDLAVGVMTGTEFAGRPVKRQGGVLFIAAEGRHEIPIRLEAINKTKCNSTERLPFACLEECPRLLDRNAAEKIAAAAKIVDEELRKRFGLPLVLIEIDTVTAAAKYRKSGDENDAAIAQQIMDTLAEISRRTGTFVLAIDHFGKNVETGTRGSSAKESFADIVLAILGERELGGAVKNPRMAARKRRDGPNGEEFAFTTRSIEMGIDEDGAPVNTLVIEWNADAATTTTPKAEWPKSLRLLHRILMRLIGDCGTEITPWLDAAPVHAVDQELVRTEFYKSYPADGETEKKRQDARKHAFSRSIRDAQARTLIGVRTIDTTTFLWLGNP